MLQQSLLHGIQDWIGISPAKRGRPSIIPDCLYDALATHSTMMQVAGTGEASSGKIISLTAGLVARTVGRINLILIIVGIGPMQRTPQSSTQLRQRTMMIVV